MSEINRHSKKLATETNQQAQERVVCHKHSRVVGHSQILFLGRSCWGLAWVVSESSRREEKTVPSGSRPGSLLISRLGLEHQDSNLETTDPKHIEVDCWADTVAATSREPLKWFLLSTENLRHSNATQTSPTPNADHKAEVSLWIGLKGDRERSGRESLMQEKIFVCFFFPIKCN